MNLEDKQFDDFLNAKFGQKQFELKPQYWQNANKMIQASRGATSSVILTASVALVAVVSVVAALLLNQNSSANQTIATTSLPTQNVLLASTTNAMPAMNGASISKTQQSVSTIENNSNTPSIATNEPKGNSSSNTSHSIVKPRKPLASRKAMNNALVEKPTNINEVIETKKQQDIVEITANIFKKRSVANTPNQAQEAEASSAYLKYIAPQQKLFVIANAGINIQNGMNATSSLIAGYYIQPKIAITAGVGYARLNQQLGSRVYNEVSLGFGQNINQTRITTQRLDYILLPIGVQYDVCKKHHFTGGAQLGYVLQSTDLVETNTASTTENGYLNAINRTDVQLMTAYRYDFTRKLSVSAAYHFGLKDVSNNSVFNNTTNNRNQFISISLGYKLY